MRNDLLRLAAKFDILAKTHLPYLGYADGCRWAATLASMKVTADAKQNVEYLEKLNLKEIQKKKGKPPQGVDPRAFFLELQNEAKAGPLFSADVLRAILTTGDRLTKDQARDLGNSLRGHEMDVDRAKLIEVADWIHQNKPALQGKSFEQLLQESNRWHRSLVNQPRQITDQGGDLGPYHTDEVVKRWPDGTKLVSVKDPRDLEVEGDLMGHCVGGYCERVDSGKATILSLRDRKNLPHVTIELNPLQGSFYVNQVRGKGNARPHDKYVPYLVDFFTEKDLWRGEAVQFLPDDLVEEKFKSLSIPEQGDVMRTTKNQKVIKEYAHNHPDETIGNPHTPLEVLKEIRQPRTMGYYLAHPNADPADVKEAFQILDEKKAIEDLSPALLTFLQRKKFTPEEFRKLTPKYATRLAVNDHVGRKEWELLLREMLPITDTYYVGAFAFSFADFWVGYPEDMLRLLDLIEQRKLVSEAKGPTKDQYVGEQVAGEIEEHIKDEKMQNRVGRRFDDVFKPSPRVMQMLSPSEDDEEDERDDEWDDGDGYDPDEARDDGDGGW